MNICDHDCFRCKFDDCICDDMTPDDYAEARERDFALTRTPEQKKIAAKQKAYYEANRDEIAAKNAEIKALRKRLKLTQTDVAMIVGVSRQAEGICGGGRSKAHALRVRWTIADPSLRSG